MEFNSRKRIVVKEILLAVAYALPIHFFPNYAQEFFQMLVICILTLIFFELVDVRKNTQKP
jgi:hypothetical protein